MHRSRKRFVAKMPEEGRVCREQQNQQMLFIQVWNAAVLTREITSDATHLTPQNWRAAFNQTVRTWWGKGPYLYMKGEWGQFLLLIIMGNKCICSAPERTEVLL